MVVHVTNYINLHLEYVVIDYLELKKKKDQKKKEIKNEWYDCYFYVFKNDIIKSKKLEIFI